MRKVLLTVFAVIMLVSCAKSREYPEMVFNYISEDITTCTLYMKDSETTASFIADDAGNIYIDIFALSVPGSFYSMSDNSTNIQVVTNSRETMVYYNGKLYIDGREKDFFKEGQVKVIDSRVMMELRCVEDTFGAEFEFKKKKEDFYPSLAFYHEVFESQKIDGGEVSSLRDAPNIASVEKLSEDHCTAVYSGVVTEEFGGRFRLEAINGLLTKLAREGFEVIDRPSDTMVLLWRGESYVSIKSWSMKDVRANYINCIMQEELE